MKDRQVEKFMDIIDNENDHREEEMIIVDSKQTDGNPSDSTLRQDVAHDDAAPKKRGRKPKKSIVTQEENLLENLSLELREKDGEKDFDNKEVDINKEKDLVDLNEIQDLQDNNADFEESALEENMPEEDKKIEKKQEFFPEEKSQDADYSGDYRTGGNTGVNNRPQNGQRNYNNKKKKKLIQKKKKTVNTRN